MLKTDLTPPLLLLDTDKYEKMQHGSHFQETIKEYGASHGSFYPWQELEGGVAAGWTMERLSPCCHYQQLATTNKLIQEPSESLTPMQYS